MGLGLLAGGMLPIVSHDFTTFINSCYAFRIRHCLCMYYECPAAGISGPYMKSR